MHQVYLLDIIANFVSQNKRKLDAEMPAAREKQNWY